MASTRATCAVFCNVCEKRHINAKAIYLCPICEEHLCTDCSDHHSLMKLSKSHVCIPVNDMQKLPDFIKKIRTTCDDHLQPYSFFCPNHNMPCCAKCLISLYKNCQGIACVEDVMKNAKSSPGLKDLEQTLTDLYDYSKTVQDSITTFQSDFTEKQNGILIAVREIRRRVMEHFDNIEKEMISEINQVSEERLIEHKELLEKITKSKDNISSLISNLEVIKEHASEYQVFFATKEIEKMVIEEDNVLQSLSSSEELDEKQISFTENPAINGFINKVKNVGMLNVTSIPKHLKLTKKNDKEAQLFAACPMRNISQIKLQLERLVNFPTNFFSEGNMISSCSFSQNGNIIFSIFSYNKSAYTDKLAILRDIKEDICEIYLSECTQRYSMMGIVSIDECTLAIATCGDKTILLVEFLNDHIKHKIHTSGECMGITFTNGKLLYFIHNEGLYTYDLKTKQSEIEVRILMDADSFITCANSHIYFTRNHDSVVCSDMGGNTLWTFSETSVLTVPQGIAIDKDGFVYVAGENSNNLVVISPDGSDYRVLLSEKDGLFFPCAVDYDRKTHSIVVCNHHTEAFLYRIG